jgi:SHS2 domain-containing protein
LKKAALFVKKRTSFRLIMENLRFETLPHTADKSIKVFGRDLKELFENAAYGMFSQMAELEKYKAVQTSRVEIEAEETPELLRVWLAELLYTFEVERILFIEFEVEKIDETHVSGIAKGLPFNREIEWLGSILKAVTHQDLDVRRANDGWEAQIVFDV